MNLFEKWIKNQYLVADSLGVLLVRVSGLIVQIAVFTLIARTHSLQDVGIYAVANAIWVIIRGLGSGGYDQAILRFVPEFTIKNKPDWISKFFRFASSRILIFWISVFFISFITSGFILIFLPSFQLFGVLMIFVAAGLPAYALMSIDICFLRTQNKVLSAQIPESLYLHLLVASGIGFMHFMNLTSIVLTLAIQASAAWCILYLYRKKINLNAAPRDSNKIESEPIDLPAINLQAINRMAFSTMKGKIATSLAARSAVIILPIFISSGEIALFEAGLKFGILASLPVWAVGVVVAPLISKASANKNRDELKRIYTIGNLLQTIPAVLILIILIFFGETLLTTLLGEKFRPAYNLTVIISLATTINAAGSIASSYLLMTKGEKTVEIFSILALVVMVFGVSAGTISFGLAGAGWALVARSLVRDIGMAIYVANKRNLTPGLFSLGFIRKKIFSP